MTTSNNDPTQGRKLGAALYEDPTQGQVGARADEDPAQGRQLGAAANEDPTQGARGGRRAR